MTETKGLTAGTHATPGPTTPQIEPQPEPQPEKCQICGRSGVRTTQYSFNEIPDLMEIKGTEVVYTPNPNYISISMCATDINQMNKLKKQSGRKLAPRQQLDLITNFRKQNPIKTLKRKPLPTTEQWKERKELARIDREAREAEERKAERERKMEEIRERRKKEKDEAGRDKKLEEFMRQHGVKL